MGTQHHHNQGQRDAAKGTYRPPHNRGLLSELLFGISKREIAETNAYRQGWREGKRKSH